MYFSLKKKKSWIPPHATGGRLLLVLALLRLENSGLSVFGGAGKDEVR